MMQPKQPLRSSRNTNLATPGPHLSKKKNIVPVALPATCGERAERQKAPDQDAQVWLRIFRITTNRIVLSMAALFTLHSSSLCQTPSATAPVPGKPAPVVPNRYHTQHLSNRAQQYYSLVWGIDSLTVKSVESGELIKFTYRVIDPNKARVLNDKKSEPFLIDPRAGVKLVVPSLEKVGQLRQSSTPEAGKVYWMAFSNKGRLVRPGHFVDVSIGLFRANGLIVQ
jgi:hypothetical protein